MSYTGGNSGYTSVSPAGGYGSGTGVTPVNAGLGNGVQDLGGGSYAVNTPWGYQTYNRLQDAQAAASSFYPQTSPPPAPPIPARTPSIYPNAPIVAPPSSVARSAPASETTQAQGGANQQGLAGALTTPGEYEQAWQRNKAAYQAPTKAETNYDDWYKRASETSNASKEWDKRSGAWDQPSDSEQMFSGLAGQFNNWSTSGLDDVYNRETDRAMATQKNMASARGMGDSSASMKASGNLAGVMADKKVKGIQSWATTGMGLAGASDAARTSRFTNSMTGAGLADAADRNTLSDMTGVAGAYDTAKAGRLNNEGNAAKTAQDMFEDRYTGAIDRATNLGQGLAGITERGTTSASNSRADLEMKLAELEMNKGVMDQGQYYSEYNDIMKAIQALPPAVELYGDISTRNKTATTKKEP